MTLHRLTGSGTQITPTFVKEAYSLLRQSIIHVEQDEIGLDDEEDEEIDAAIAAMDEDEAAGGGAQPPPSSSAPGPSQSSPIKARGQTPAAAAPSPAPQKAKKPKVSISYEKYMGIMSLVVTKLSDVEKHTGGGMPRADLAQWYLEEMADNLGTAQELEAETVLIQKVLSRLVKVGLPLLALVVPQTDSYWSRTQEKYLLELRGEGQGLQAAQGDGEGEGAPEEAGPILLVHPEARVGDLA